MSDSADRRAIEDLIETLRHALDRSREAGTTGVAVLGAGVDDAVRALIASRVDRAIGRVTTSSTTDLAAALEPARSTASVAGRVGQVGGRLARRSRTARAVMGRTPTGLALRWGPLLVDAVRGWLRTVDAAAAHLVGSARRHGVEPDPDRVRTAIVQALSGDAIDPDGTADHARLARAWLADAGRAAAPLGLGSLGRHGRDHDPARIVAALADVDPRNLRRRR